MRNRVKITLTALAAAVVLSGCVRSEDLGGESNAISFATTASRALKESFTVGDSFAIWGAMVDGPESVQIFDGTDVTQVSAGSWTYSPERYWFDDWSYDFCALWPASVSGNTTYNIANKSVEIGNFNTTQGTDLLMAKLTGITYDPVNPTVALQFSHMMSQISIQGANADDGLEIEVTNIRFVGKAQASYDGTEWTQNGSTATLAQSSTSTELLQGTYKTLLENILVVPNAIDSDMRIILTYTVNGAMKPNRTIPLSAASLTSLEPGKKYIYKFTLDPAGNIIFERPTVDTWGSIYGGTFVVDPDPGSND